MIVGVVAALTIPNLIVKYQKELFITRLKQTYSILENAKRMAEKDYGYMKNWEVANGEDMNFLRKYVFPYVKIQEGGTRYESHTTYNLNGTALSPTLDPLYHWYYYKFMLSNGVQVAIYGCDTINYWGGYCVIYVDVNGKKKPNVFGKDIHAFRYFLNSTYVHNLTYNGTFGPFGYKKSLDTLKTECLSGTKGESCTAALMHNGWKYPDWYPM